ncbi:hypothetical protein COCON_G00031870 [Conger conger]|uniref:Secreted protein n=1 Tax=Conger conger TaxID=82655 RepID=A0A9Q1I5G0_CONCO|nr:hypothetical protein COCON_G00031870 [Conger conger]
MPWWSSSNFALSLLLSFTPSINVLTYSCDIVAVVIYLQSSFEATICQEYCENVKFHDAVSPPGITICFWQGNLVGCSNSEVLNLYFLCLFTTCLWFYLHIFHC